MTARTLCAWDPNRCDGSLLLSQGNLVVTTNALVDYHRSVFGTIALGSGMVGFETKYYSTEYPAAGLTNPFAVGVAEISEATNKYVGEGALSYGLRVSDGAGNAGFYNNNTLVGATFPFVQERNAIGVLLDCTVSPPILSFQVNGNYLGQMTLTAGKVYRPAVSVAGLVSGGGDISCITNFGQYLFDFPMMTVNK